METLTITAAGGMFEVEARNVSHFAREENNTRFIMGDIREIVSTLSFEHYVEAVKDLKYFVQINDDGVVNIYFIKSYIDEDGEEHLNPHMRKDDPN